MSKIHLAFDDNDELAGQWADVVDIAARSPRYFERVQQASEGQGTEEGARLFLAAIVSAWNVIGDVSQKPLAPPSSTECDILDVPSYVLKRIREEYERQLGELSPKVSP